MVKESKSSVTIRRRTRQNNHGCKEKVKSSHNSDDETKDAQPTEDSYLFDEEILGPSVMQKILSSERTLILGLVSFRVINALMIQTSYVPDEYWQSLEVAHKMSFGYGYLTWEWRHGLRGYTYPLLYSILYRVLAIFRLDYRILLIKAPKILQGVFAAYGDLYLYKLSRKLTDRPTAQWALLCQCLSWFTFYCCTRTLTNSAESVLTTIALYYFPWPGQPRSSGWRFLWLASLSVIIRPTAAIMWVLMCSWHLQQNKTQGKQMVKLYGTVGITSLALSTAVDCVWYGKWVFVHYNFLKFNVLSNMAAIYGTHPWHWYLSQGYPVIMATHIYPFLMGAWRANNKVLLWLIIWTIFLYSFLGHKEFRFLLPILPLSMHYCGVYFQSLCKRTKVKKAKKSSPAADSSSNSGGDVGHIPDTKAADLHQANLSKAKVLVLILLVTNVPAAMYFGLIHQRGNITVMRYLYEASLEKQSIDIVFLMPCHSTPYYSYLHRISRMKFLTCEPNLSGNEDYVDEADVFYQDPEKWLNETYMERPWPSHLVYFSSLSENITTPLESHAYHECGRFFHTHLPEGRVGTHVVVSCK